MDNNPVNSDAFVVNIPVRLVLDPWAPTRDEAVQMVKSRLVAFKYPVGMEVKEASTPDETYNAAKNRATQAIDHSCDGPVTPFVMVARAIRLARESAEHDLMGDRGHVDDPIANALFDLLKLAGVTFNE